MRILIVEDSDTVALLLKAIFNAETDMEVVARACNGREAIDMAAGLLPDVITMDIRMPVMDGFEATREIMASNPTPIVVISSSVDDEEMKITFRAIEAGALTVIEKPRGITHPEFEAMRHELVSTVRAMAEVRLVRRIHRQVESAPVSTPTPVQKADYQLVAIGCSTGGPQVLKKILSDLPASFSLPILVVQHISPGFIDGMVNWLNTCTEMQVKLAEDQEVLRPGTVYLGPDGFHLTITQCNGCLCVHLSSDELVNGFRPSATPLLESVARACGEKAIGCILTGMGADGAPGLLELFESGAYTFVQDEASSTVFGMPASALEIGATQNIVKLDDIAGHLCNLSSV